MRKDMYKVIVERPRRGGRYSKELRPPSDPEDQPQHESLKFRHRSRKWLNENLNPLRRYLGRQAGRRWDEVYSELCANIDRRNTVQQHIHEHLEDFVALRVQALDGALHYERGYGGLQRLDRSWAPKLYVDPVSGLLLINHAGIQARREAKREYARARRAQPEVDVRALDEFHQLRRIDGIWYEVELAELPRPVAVVDRHRKSPRLVMPYDVIARRPARWIGKPCGHRGCEACRPYGGAGLYARSKRQLNRHELQRYSLRNHEAERLH
ncbi:hypothetical protein ASD78_07830 [Lysobacter sp. Root667]|nr:hypothetical protein ASD78_07830 [Lysobacter sp. Root667]